MLSPTEIANHTLHTVFSADEPLKEEVVRLTSEQEATEWARRALEAKVDAPDLA